MKSKICQIAWQTFPGSQKSQPGYRILLSHWIRHCSVHYIIAFTEVETSAAEICYLLKCLFLVGCCDDGCLDSFDLENVYNFIILFLLLIQTPFALRDWKFCGGNCIQLFWALSLQCSTQSWPVAPATEYTRTSIQVSFVPIRYAGWLQATKLWNPLMEMQAKAAKRTQLVL